MTSTQTSTAELHVEPRLQHKIYAAFSNNSKEDITYGIIIDFLLEHRQSAGRFSIYPQLGFPWKPDNPKDRRREVPDIVVGNLTLDTPGLKMRIGIESKKMIETMHGIPEPSPIQNNEYIQNSFQKSIIQGEDQTKAEGSIQRQLYAIKNSPISALYWAIFRVGRIWPVYSRPTWGTLAEAFGK
jgi:hypothetical protein